MSSQRTRTDELLDTWMAATARPIPNFRDGSASRRRPRRTFVLVLAVIALILLALGTLAIGALVQRRSDTVPSAELAHSAVAAIADAPGVRFTLKISTHSGDGISSTDASGLIDFAKGRFSGTADGGSGGGSMSLFGGPTRGGVIVADGLFVQTEGQPWVAVTDGNPQLQAFLDPVRLSRALQAVVDSSAVDPAIRSKPCGSETCRVITLSAPPTVLLDAEASMLGVDSQPPPADFGPTVIELLIDPSGFPVRMDTTLEAGPTTTPIGLELARLDPVPTISPPIP